MSDILPKLPEGWYRGNRRHRMIMEAHGVGNTSLRKALWDHLKKCSGARLFWYFIGLCTVLSFFMAHPERFWPVTITCFGGMVVWYVVVGACYAHNYDWMRNEQIIAERKRRGLKDQGPNPLRRINSDRVARIWGLVCLVGTVYVLARSGLLDSPFR